ncbi:MAG: DUF3800 domain-containing protein [Candidatus Saccharibacteria bacterium]|nr:DUF3800 domain-containing protein [Candidatus Saccharibacteria bacterium]
MENPNLPFVFMDESGNKTDDRFFVCGFLEVLNPFKFNQSLYRVREQIFNTVQNKRSSRADNLLETGAIDELYQLARKQSFFELKFGKVTLHTLGLYNDLLKALAAKCSFRFKAIVIDRDQHNYEHESLEGMYKRICRLYFDHCQQESCIFIPDQFDPNFDWEKVIARPQKVSGVLPATSHEFLPLQTVDLLTGIVRLGLEIKSGEKRQLGRNDTTRKQLVDTFENAFQLKIKPVVDSSKSGNYVGIWTIKFPPKPKKARA